MISLLLPTKGRSKSVHSLIESIQETVLSLKNINLLLLYDKEDKSDRANVYNFFNFSITERNHSDYLNRDYYNYLAEISSEKYLWAIGDDIRFLTPLWDKILEKRIEEYLKDKSDRIAYISVNEEGSKAKHPCFPIITKEAFKFFNMYFHSELLSWGADRCLWELYSGINRTLYIPEISISHLSYHDGKAEFDSTAASMKERFFRDSQCHNIISRDVVPNQIKKFKEFIDGKTI